MMTRIVQIAREGRRHLRARPVWLLGALAAIPTALSVVPIAPRAIDFTPFYVASRFEAEGRYDAVYPPPAPDGFGSVSPEFRDKSAVNAGISPENVTAFLSPPPALLLYRPLTWLPYSSALALFFAATGLPALFAAFALHAQRPAHGLASDLLATLMLFATLLLLMLSGAIGQTSTLLFFASWIAVFGPHKRALWASAALGATLGALTLLKLSPLLLLVGTLALGMRWTFVIGVAIISLLTLYSLATMPSSLWETFVALSRHLSAQNIPYQANLTIENALSTYELGVFSETFTRNMWWHTAFAWTLKLPLLVGALAVLRRGGDVEKRWGAVVVVWLLLTPLLWGHYLVALLPSLWREMRNAATLREAATTVAIVVLVTALTLAGVVGAIPPSALTFLRPVTWLIPSVYVLWKGYSARL